MFTDTDKTFPWISKGLQKESFKTTAKLSFIHNGGKGAKLKENCSIQSNVSFTQRRVGNLFIDQELNKWSRDLNKDFAPSDCLFRSVKFPENAHPYKYQYSSYGTGFEASS